MESAYFYIDLPKTDIKVKKKVSLCEYFTVIYDSKVISANE